MTNGKSSRGGRPWAVRAVVAVLLSAAGLLHPAPAPLAAAAASAGRTGRPDVVVLVTDDQDCHSFGAATCGWMHPTNPMPRTHAWLAGSGSTLTRFYSANPSCCPDRSSLMTGQYPHNHGVQTLQQGGRLNARHTVQYALRKAGYRTGMWGKYLNSSIDVAPPYFDDFTVVEGGTYYDSRVNSNGLVGSAGADVYAQTLIADQAVDFIRSTPRDRPLYAYVAFTAPHMLDEERNLNPVPERKYSDAPVPPWQAPVESDRSDKPPFIRDAIRTPERQRALHVDRQRTLYSVDDATMRIRAALAATGRLDNTLVVFLSDNGFALGEHGLRGKFNPYLPSLQIPGALCWPGHVPAGSVDRRLTSVVDIAPTVYAATGVPAPAVLDGHSLLDRTARRSLVFAEYRQDRVASHRYPTWATTVTTRRQVTAWYEDGGAIRETETYDLATDPDQMGNLGAPAVADLRLLSAFRRCAGRACFR